MFAGEELELAADGDVLEVFFKGGGLSGDTFLAFANEGAVKLETVPGAFTGLSEGCCRCFVSLPPG